MTRKTAESSFLAAHAAPLPAHVTRESVGAAIVALTRRGGWALELDEFYRTLFDAEGRALCAVTRPRVLDREGLHTVTLSDGRTVAAFPACPTVKKALEAVYSYLAAPLPGDCDPAAELDSYRASFRENWAVNSTYPMFRASALTRAARWARRIGAAEAEAEAQARAAEPKPEPAPVAAVDVTPTWEGVARIIELGLTHDNATGRQIAREELTRMARIADSAVAAAKAAELAKASPDALAEALDMARACLAAYPAIGKGKGRESEPARGSRDFRDALAALVGALEGRA